MQRGENGSRRDPTSGVALIEGGGARGLARGSKHERGVERGHGAARVRAERSGELGRERSSRRRRRV